MANTNPFTSQNYDLGTNELGIDRAAVDTAFKDSPFIDTGYRCIVCNQVAQLKLIPKSPSMNSIEIEKRGYVCEHHLHSFSPEHYGIRKL